MMNMIKLMTFFRKEPFDIKAQIAEDGPLLPKTSKELGSYRIEVPVQGQQQKIKVQAKMSMNGMFTIEKAQLCLEEEYEETVKEQREVGADGQPKPEGEGGAAEGEQKTEEDGKKEAEKKFEWV